jgi:PKD repeat protein
MKNIAITLTIVLCALLPALLTAQDTANPTNQNTWQVTPSDYANSMIITAVIDIEGEESTDPDDRVAVFIEGTNNIRGVGSPVFIPVLDRYVMSLFVYSTNGAADNLRFQVYDAGNDLVLPSTSSEVFNIDKVSGSFSQPDTIFTIRIQSNFTKDDVLCAADNNGFAKANVTGGTPPYSYQWSTGGITDSIGGLNAGRYFLTITDSNGFNKADSVDILNLNRPITSPTLVVAPADTVCEGQDVYFFAFTPETEDPTYLWYDNFGNFIQEDDALFIPDIANSQEYEVFTDVRNCLSAPSEIEVAVQAVPSSDFAISNAAPTPNDTIVFNPNANGSDVEYLWDFGDGNTSTAAVPSHAYSSAGNYQVSLTITTPEGCSATSAEFLSVDERAIDILLDIEQPACDDAPSGTISAQALNGVAPYSFLWSTGDTLPEIKDLVPGTYGLTVTDAQGNTQETSIALQASADFSPPQVAINSGGAVCQGDDILLSAFSEEENVAFYWYNDDQGNGLLGVGPQLQLYNVNSLSVWVQAVRGECSTGLTQVDLQSAILDAGFSVSQSAVPLGAATVFTADQVDPALTYTWDLGDGTVATSSQPLSHTYTFGGTYEATLTVSSADGCESSSTQFINVWGGALQLIPNIVDASCEGDPSGAVSLTVQNGQPPFSYQWSTGSQQASIEGLLPGDYGVTVTDADGLTASAQFSLGSSALAPDAPTLIVNGGNTLCGGEDTYINAFSNVPNAIFYWYEDPTATTPIHVGPTLFLFDVQLSTEYYVEARTGNCASVRALADVNVSAPDAGFFPSAQVVFTGQEIDFEVVSPASNTLYSWEWGDNELPGSGSSTVHTYSLPGIYEVQLFALRTNTGCRAMRSVRIQVLLPSDIGGGGNGGGGDTPLSALPLSEPARCAGSNTGQASAIAFGGEPPYSFEWSTGSTAALLTDIPPGTYGLTVTDAQGNTAVGSTVVAADADLPAPSAIVNGGQPVCVGESVWVAAASGVAGAEYQWFSEASDTEPLYIGQMVQVDGLAGPDTLYLQASNGGCLSERIEVPIAVEGAYAYFAVDPAAPAVGADVGFTADSLSADYVYQWAFGDGEEAIGPLATHAYGQAGLYEAILEVATENGCIARQRRFINVQAPNGGNGTFAVALSLEHPLCPDDQTGSITPLVFGGTPPYSYEWSTGGTGGSLLNIGAGTYSLTVTDDSGQTAVNEVDLQSLQPSIPAPEAGVAGNGLACLGGGAWLAATGGEPGTQFTWHDAPSGGNLVFTGSYLEVNNLQGPLALFAEARYEGCVSATRTPVFVDVEEADASFAASPAVAPIGTSVNFLPNTTTGQSYSWDFGDGNGATGSTASHTYTAEGSYTVRLETQTDAGCTDVQTQSVRILPEQELQFQVEMLAASCAGEPDGGLSLIAEGGQPPYSISWSDGSTEFSRSGLASGLYTLTLSDNSGQSISEAIELGSEVPALSITQAGISGGQAPCPQEPLTLAAISNVSSAQVVWYDAESGGNLLYVGASFPMMSPSSPITVYAEAQLDGCTSPTRSAVDIVPQAPDASFSFLPANPLSGEPVTFEAATAGGGAQYAWDFGDGSSSSLAAPTYTYANDGVYEVALTVTAGGCSFTATQLVTVGFGQALGLVLEATPTQCDGGSDGAVAAQAVNGTPPYTFAWSNGQAGNFVQGLTQGSYVATVTDADGNTAVAETQVASLTPELPVPQAASNNSLLCPDEVLILYAFDNTGTAGNFFWYDSPQGGNLLGAGSTYSQQGINGTSQTFYVEAASGICRSSERRPMTVAAEQPNLGFTASATTVVLGNTVSFAPILADSSYSYEWSFGDGAVSTQMTPAHTYGSPGQYTVGLRVTSGNGCIQTIQEPALVQVVPEGALTVLLDISQPACEEDATGSISVDILNGVPPYDYDWDGGQSGASIAGLTAGQYSLTVTDAGGNSVIRVIQLAPLFPKPEVPAVSPGPGSTPLCLSQPRVLTASSGQTVDQYYWYIDGGLAGTGFSLVVDPDEAGSFPIQVQAQRGSCFSDFANLLYDVEALDAGFEATIAPALSLTAFVPDVQGYASYHWDFGDGNTSTLMQPSHLYTAPGQYTVILEVESQAGCQEALAQTITIEADTGLQVDLEKEDVLCPTGNSGRILAQISGGQPPYSFLWSTGSTMPEITGLEVGTYSLTVTDNGGDGAEASVEILSLDEELPEPAVTANGGAPVCKNEPAYLSGEVPGYPSAGIAWYETAGGNMSMQTGSVLILPGLEENIELYAESTFAGCRSTRVTVPVEVQAPEVAFSTDPGRQLEAGGLVQFIPENPQPGYSYYWEFGDNGWSMSQAPYYFYNMAGVYDASLEITDGDGCSNRLVKEDWIEVVPFDGLVGKGSEETEIRAGQLAGSRHIEGQAFPNPFGDELSIVLKVAKAGRYRMALTDAYGREVWGTEALLDTRTYNWHLQLAKQQLGPGLYVLRIAGEEEQAVLKLVKGSR